MFRLDNIVTIQNGSRLLGHKIYSIFQDLFAIKLKIFLSKVT